MDAAEVDAKYRRRRVRIPMKGVGLERDPQEVSRNSGKKRIWGPEAPRPRRIADFGRSLKEHDLLKKQIRAGEYMR